MDAISHYTSPLGKILLTSDEIGLTGLWFDGQRNFTQSEYHETETPTIIATRQWLDIFFSGREPNFTVPLHPTGTIFQMEVWQILRAIPYGRATTYGEIAGQIAKQRSIPKMSAQAVGGAVGRNKIGIIIPCHRVLGADGQLTGYAGGLDKKAELLRLEGIEFIAR